MATITVEGMCRFTYTISANNSSDYGTLTFTLNGAENLSPSKYKRKKGFWAGIKIDGKNFVGCTADIMPTAKHSSDQVASGVLGVSETSNGRPVVYISDKQEYKEFRKLYNDTQQKYLSDNIEVLKDKINKKVSAGKNSKTIKVTGNQRAVTIVFQVYGYKQTITQKIGKSSSTSSNTSEEGVEYTSITSVNNGIPYLVKEDAYKEYGWIEKVVDFNDIEDPATLKRVGQIYLDSLQFDEMSIEVTALDLHYIDNTIQKLSLLDSVRCISKPHGLDKAFPITKVTIPLDHPDQVKYTLGTNQAGGGGISASSSKDAKKFIKSLESFPTKAYTLDTAKGQMSQMLNQRTTGYVNIVDRSENGQTRSEAIIISSGQDWTTSQSLWKWDMNGLGFSDKKLSDMSQQERTAYNASMTALGSRAVNKVTDEDRWYRLGITNDGKIVADVIKTGLLSDAKGLNEWDLTNGTFKLTGMTTVVDDSSGTPSSTTLKNITTTSNEAKTMAGTAIGTANTANNKQYGYTNYLKGTKSPVLKSDSPSNQANSYASGWWLTSSSTNATPSVANDISLAGGIKAYVNLPSKTSVRQTNVPLEPGTSYTVSCKAKYRNTGPKHNETKLTIEVFQQEHPSVKMAPKTCTLTSSFATYFGNFKVPSSNNDSVKYVVKFSNTSSYAAMIYGFKVEKGNMATDWSDQNNISADDVYNNMVEYVDTYGKLKSASTLATLTQANIIKRLTGMDAGKNPNGMWLAGGKLYISATSIRSGKIISDNSKSYWDLTTGELLSVNSTFTGKIENIEQNAGRLYYYTNAKHTKTKSVYFNRLVNVQNGLCAFRATYKKDNTTKTVKAGSIGVETRSNIYSNNLCLEITANQSLAVTAPMIEIRSKPSSAEVYAETKTVKVLSYDKKKIVTLKFVNGFYVGDGSGAAYGSLGGRT